MSDELKRLTPTPRAQRILDEIGSLTVRDVVWLNRELAKLLGYGDFPSDGSAVREPRRPAPSAGGEVVRLELPGWPGEERL